METIINYLGLIIGIILSVIGIFLQLRSTKKKEPVYSIKSNNLITDSSAIIEKLQVLYENVPVNNLTVSKILFYNNGAETITRQDTETITPLYIGFTQDVHLLDFKLLQVNNVSNNFTIEIGADNDSVKIGFDFLDKNQGAVIQIVHDGLKSDDIVVAGAIMGVEKLVHVGPKQLTSRDLKRTERGLLLGSTLMTLIFWSLLLSPQTRSALPSSASILVLLVVLVLIAGIGATLIVAIAVISSILSIAIPRYFLPAGLEKFNE